MQWQICGCVWQKDLRISKRNTLILTGKRNFNDGLWYITLNPRQYNQENMNLIIQKDQTKTKLAEYLHKCAYSPAISTFLRAICCGCFQSWPGIESINFKNVLQNLIPTAKGHLGVRSKQTPMHKGGRRRFFPIAWTAENVWIHFDDSTPQTKRNKLRRYHGLLPPRLITWKWIHFHLIWILFQSYPRRTNKE